MKAQVSKDMVNKFEKLNDAFISATEDMLTTAVSIEPERKEREGMWTRFSNRVRRVTVDGMEAIYW